MEAPRPWVLGSAPPLRVVLSPRPAPSCRLGLGLSWTRDVDVGGPSACFQPRSSGSGA